MLLMVFLTCPSSLSFPYILSLFYCLLLSSPTTSLLVAMLTCQGKLGSELCYSKMLLKLIKSSRLDLGAAAEYDPVLRALLGYYIATPPDPPCHPKRSKDVCFEVDASMALHTYTHKILQVLICIQESQKTPWPTQNLNSWCQALVFQCHKFHVMLNHKLQAQKAALWLFTQIDTQ